MNPHTLPPTQDPTPTISGALKLTPETIAGGSTTSNANDPNRTTGYDQPSRVGIPQIDGFEIIEELGRGGMGIVYLARQTQLGRLVALKMIKSADFADRSAFERFQGEAQIVAKLQHPNIVLIHEANPIGTQPYFALEFLDGGSLDQKLQAKPLTATEAAALLEKLGRGMQYAHEHGIIHRDLKPQNILLSKAGEPKITDFGLAKQQSVDRTGSFAQMGTPNYMAPEQAAGHIKEVGPPADIYALGVILYECLTGRTPFRGANVMAVLEQVRAAEPVAIRTLQPQTPKDLETICLKCLQKEPAKRYVSASALADDLKNFLESKPISARPVSRAERSVKWCRRYPAAAALVAVSFTAAVVATGLAVWALRERDIAAKERDDKGKALSAEITARKSEQAARVHALTALRSLTDEIVENQMARGATLTDENKEFLRTIIKQYDGFAAMTGDNAEGRAIRAEGYMRVAVMRYRLGELKEADQAFAQSLILNQQLVAESPNDSECLVGLGQVLANQGSLLNLTGRTKLAGTKTRPP